MLLHATRHDELEIAAAQIVGGDHGGAHAGAADLADGERAGLDRHAGLDSRLPRRRLPEPGRQNAAHVDLVDVAWLELGALQGAGDGARAQRRSGESLERALEGANRGRAPLRMTISLMLTP
jgi:hypothetical protein